MVVAAVIAAHVLVSVASSAARESPPDDAACFECHADAGITKTLSDGSEISLTISDSVYANSVHGRGGLACTDCHASIAEVPHSDELQAVDCGACHDAQAAEFATSVHGRAAADGHGAGPSCAGCHGAHDVLPPEDAGSRVSKRRVPSTCGACHADEAAVYAESVHGQAVAGGNTDAPACNDCHGEHRIEPAANPTSLVYPKKLVETTCVRCHESQLLAQRYGFRADRGTTFRETYHGLATRLGGLPVANCASCHGVHDIFPSADPRSTVYPGNLQATCGHCHPSASVAFTQVAVHTPATLAPRHPIARVLRTTYIVLIAVAVGGMLAHNGIVWGAHVVRKFRREAASRQVRRFTTFEVVEHFLLILSFTGLVVSGFALKYSGAIWVQWLARYGFDERIRSVSHRAFGVILVALAISHTVFLILTRRGRRELGHLRPARKDVDEAVGTLAYFLGRRREKPRPGRFSYAEKVEYLALMWGTVVMALTGIVLWAPSLITRWGPAWLIEASEVVHFYEAWLAFLAILIWHTFFVIFHPEEFPMNLTFVTGKTTQEKAQEREPADDERLAEEESPAPPATDVNPEPPAGGSEPPQRG